MPGKATHDRSNARRLRRKAPISGMRGRCGSVADGTIIAMDPRPLTQRECAVLEALLSVDFDGVENLRRQVVEVVVVGMCGCGCPSIDFQHGRGLGMTIRVNAAIPDSYGGLAGTLVRSSAT